MTIFAPYASTELPILNRFNGGAAKRHRETKQRQIVLEAVQAHRDHPCAEQIYEDVCKIDDKISRGTSIAIWVAWLPIKRYTMCAFRVPIGMTAEPIAIIILYVCGAARLRMSPWITGKI